MLIVGPELVDNVCQVLTRRLHSLHQPVEDVLYTGIFSVGNRNVKEGFKSWNLKKYEKLLIGSSD